MPKKVQKRSSIIRISTKTGDAGETGLANGERLSKASPLFEIIGTLDELNSWLGLVVVGIPKTDKQRKIVYAIQNTLFVVGAELAKSPKAALTQRDLTLIERQSEELQLSMAENWHSKFLLPGGTKNGAHCDIARTVSRRLERVLVSYHHIYPVRSLILQYINRLSDYLYVLRCYLNEQAGYAEQEFHIHEMNDNEC